MSAATILVVDDEANIRATLAQMLELEGYEVIAVGSGEEAIGRLARTRVDAQLVDIMLPDMSGIDVLRAQRDAGSEVPTIVMSAHATIETAIESTRLGALDFIEKPLTAERVLLSLENALARNRLEQQNRDLKDRLDVDTELIGDSAPMRALRDVLARVGPTDGRVLVLGESGTGKELVARAVHELSSRAAGPFVVMNCAAVPGELIESELFGHEKGAFTGALKRHQGRFERAHRGTLFLDEIGDMPLDMQPKLLRVLEDGMVERVGGRDRIRVDVRVVAATNQDLEARIASGGFRADLYHRLNVVPVRLAPLRERPGDLAQLTAHFMALASQRLGQAPPQLTADAAARLAAYDWPGNVRELRNVVERLLILRTGDCIDAAQVESVVPAAGRAAATGVAPDTLDLRTAVRAFERVHIERAVAAAGGVMAEAARQLGIERSYLYRKMRDLGLERDAGDGDDA